MTVKHRAKAAAAVAALALALALLLGKNAAVALFDQNKAVHIKPSEIENATLIIGTHLIYLHSLNEGIYEIAVQSASDSGQDRRYYKSELAGGTWMDITYAESIRDISAGGTIADESVIERLYIIQSRTELRIIFRQTSLSASTILSMCTIWKACLNWSR